MARFIPEFIRPMLDPSFMAVLSFSGMVCFGYTYVIVLLFLTAQCIAAGTEMTGEIESKFVDLLASRPITRHLLVIRSAGMVLFLTVTSVGSLVLGSVVGLGLLAPESATRPSPAVIASLAINLALLAVAWGAIAMCFAAFANRRAMAASSAGLLAFTAFIIDVTGRLWDPVDKLAVLSPFRYYAPFALITGEPIPLLHLAVLGGIFALGTAVASFAYQRRDL